MQNNRFKTNKTKTNKQNNKQNKNKQTNNKQQTTNKTKTNKQTKVDESRLLFKTTNKRYFQLPSFHCFSFYLSSTKSQPSRSISSRTWSMSCLPWSGLLFALSKMCFHKELKKTREKAGCWKFCNSTNSTSNTWKETKGSSQSIEGWETGKKLVTSIFPIQFLIQKNSTEDQWHKWLR